MKNILLTWSHPPAGPFVLNRAVPLLKNHGEWRVPTVDDFRRGLKERSFDPGAVSYWARLGKDGGKGPDPGKIVRVFLPEEGERRIACSEANGDYCCICFVK